MNTAILTLVLLTAGAGPSESKTSQCYGSLTNGKLENGVMLPFSGNNFENYSLLAVVDGRTFVHSRIRDLVVSTYQALETEQPDKIYMYGETGFPTGGRFWPHQTHQNGLSVDFMTPVLNGDDQSDTLPTHIFNRFGYNIEFNADGHYDDYRIDYEAMAAHLSMMHQQAQEAGISLLQVTFTPELQAGLFNTSYAEYLRQHIRFSATPAWGRHDEHYHVDFDLPCVELMSKNH